MRTRNHNILARGCVQCIPENLPLTQVSWVARASARCIYTYNMHSRYNMLHARLNAPIYASHTQAISHCGAPICRSWILIAEKRRKRRFADVSSRLSVKSRMNSKISGNLLPRRCNWTWLFPVRAALLSRVAFRSDDFVNIDNGPFAIREKRNPMRETV